MKLYFHWPVGESKPPAFALQVGQVMVNGAQVLSKEALITANKRNDMSSLTIKKRNKLKLE